MSYTREEFDKHVTVIEAEMADYTREQRNEVITILNRDWPDDNGVKAMIKDKKVEIAKQATPEEIDEIFKHF